MICCVILHTDDVILHTDDVILHTDDVILHTDDVILHTDDVILHTDVLSLWSLEALAFVAAVSSSLPVRIELSPPPSCGLMRSALLPLNDQAEKYYIRTDTIHQRACLH